MVKFSDLLKIGFLLSIIILMITFVFRMIITPDFKFFLMPYLLLVGLVVISVVVIFYWRQRPIIEMFRGKDHTKYFKEHVAKLIEDGVPIRASVNDGSRQVTGFRPDINTIIGNFHVLRFWDESNPLERIPRIMLYNIRTRTSFGEFTGTNIDPNSIKAVKELIPILSQLESGTPLKAVIPPTTVQVERIYDERNKENDKSKT